MEGTFGKLDVVSRRNGGILDANGNSVWCRAALSGNLSWLCLCVPDEG